MPNQLQHETSPYLIQHKDNPVNWYPWGKEALDKAKELNKPIFLSIGYSTCHWCHVMAHESFENEEVAKLMNEAFVCIKVDREERPDLDGIYMTAVQMLTGSGGWPLNAILTPDQKPFFAGTYFPKTSRFGRIGMLDLIPRINEAWKTNYEKAIESAESLTKAIESYSNSNTGDELTENILKSAFNSLDTNFDREYGGFGDKPKFPTPHNLMFLLRYWKSYKQEKALGIVVKTLKAMHHGGIWDHIGFGLHRYSTDREWLLPHFEKMLYDQALLAIAYTEAFQASQNNIFKKVTENIFEYIFRDMQSKDSFSKGAFFSAEDADSEGEEGKFYIWSLNEIKNILNEEEAETFTKVFNIQKEGNFLDEATKEQTGNNIPHLTKAHIENAQDLRIEIDDLEGILEESRNKLLHKREQRIRPLRDDKILTDWNSLMIKALAKAGRVFQNSEYIKAAEDALDFIFKEMLEPNYTLKHSYRNNKKTNEAFLDDYIFLIDALIELHQATFKTEYLQKAIELMTKCIDLFWDENNGGFFIQSKNAETLITKQKEIYDGAIPSGNSVAVNCLLKLHLITGNSNFEEKAMEITKAFSNSVKSNPAAYTKLMCGLDFAFNGSRLIVLSSKETNKDIEKFIDYLNKEFEPNQLVLVLTEENKKELSEIIHDLKYKEPMGDKVTAYICSNKTCSQPIDNLNELKQELSKANCVQ